MNPTPASDKQDRDMPPGRPGAAPDARTVSQALRWVRENGGVREAARAAAGTPGLAMPDSLVNDPAKVVAAAEAALEAAQTHGAPDAVCGVLEGVVARYREGLQRASSLEYTRDVLKRMTGLRDRFELEGPLQTALAQAPTPADREKLSDLLDNVRNPRSLDPGFPPAADESPSGAAVPGLRRQGGCDWGCCAFSCVLCEEACILCCAAACFLC